MWTLLVSHKAFHGYSVAVMGKYWQPCFQSFECEAADPNLECVLRQDGESGNWCECREGTDLRDGTCAQLPSQLWILIKG